MAPVPYSVNGRLTLNISVDGLIHKMRFPTRIQTPISTPANLTLWPSGGAPTIQASLAAQNAWDIVRQMYENTILPADYLLEENIGGVFVPIEGSVLTNNGSVTNPVLHAGVLTFTFKDTVNHKLKLLVMESSFGYLFHSTFPSGIAALDNFVNYVAEDTGAPNGNAWITSRGGSQIQRVAAGTGALNKRLKRSRHDE